MNERLVNRQQQCTPLHRPDLAGDGFDGCWIHDGLHVRCKLHDWFHPEAEECGHCAASDAAPVEPETRCPWPCFDGDRCPLHPGALHFQCLIHEMAYPLGETCSGCFEHALVDIAEPYSTWWAE